MSTILVTGATTGLGLALSKLLLERTSGCLPEATVMEASADCFGSASFRVIFSVHG